MLLLLLPLRSVLLMLLLTLTPPMPSSLPLLLPSAELTPVSYTHLTLPTILLV